mmetsp:Transcript_50548/g.135672  ORF Transcript_50548/g.135672 Transcript_50548/m.135672 type:complete len:193 (+) Transcript_50548:168-746(+)
MEGLEETGGTFFMLERLQREYLRAHARKQTGGDRLRNSSVVAVDLYGSDRGPLADMAESDIPEFALSLLRRADPEGFRGSRLADGVRATVLRGRNAATHFAPGSRAHRPRQPTAIKNLFLAGDYVKGLRHGAEGLSQERALVTGFAAANMVMDELETSRRGRALKRQQVLELSEDEPQVAAVRDLWQRFGRA